MIWINIISGIIIIFNGDEVIEKKIEILLFKKKKKWPDHKLTQMKYEEKF